MKNPRIALVLYVIATKSWGKQRFNNQLKARAWWQRYYDEYMSGPDIPLPQNYPPKLGVLNADGNPDIPLPFENDMNFDEEFRHYWLEWIQTILKK